MKITYEQLIEHDACEEQLKLFKRIFGNEVVITEKICKKYCTTFDFEWVVDVLFPIELQDKYYLDRNTKYRLDRKCIIYDGCYYQTCVMIFYKLSLTLP